ncbi:MAG: hypothetical protein M1833_004968 [Piccolia ochrophora]|nr:MAG: hypothetical protein M1833_004968 [Piccolia ochrophora]
MDIVDWPKSQTDVKHLLQERARLTQLLLKYPYDLFHYLSRSNVYSDLEYHDLAAGDAYKALLLTDEIQEDSGEYHEEALESFHYHQDTDYDSSPGDYESRFHTCGWDDEVDDEEEEKSDDDVDDDGCPACDPEVPSFYVILETMTAECYHTLVASLLACGCLESAMDFCERGVTVMSNVDEVKEKVVRAAKTRLCTETLPPGKLPEVGHCRREIYPWNSYEPDRFSESSLSFLNAEMAKAAPKCEVRVTSLPTLTSTTTDAPASTNRQLGIFATAPIAPGEVVLREQSVLTATNRLHASLCDACHAALPALDSDQPPIPCPNPECDDTLFCSPACLAAAQSTYHPALCKPDAEPTSLSTNPHPDTLYLHLVMRALAIGQTTKVHPLRIPQLQYITGDFQTPADSTAHQSLPFNFALSIANPLHLLTTTLRLNPYTSLATTDFWILQTISAKLRSTASARVDPVDGKPEAAAVHPLWCLANHDCAPNVRWEWAGGEMAFWARDEDPVKLEGQPGVKAAVIQPGDEIRGHYCDVSLPVRERREWMMGCLGGVCMCERCRREEASGVKVEEAAGEVVAAAGEVKAVAVEVERMGEQ